MDLLTKKGKINYPKRNKTKNTYDNLSDAYDVISTLFVLISTVKESIRSKKLK